MEDVVVEAARTVADRRLLEEARGALGEERLGAYQNVDRLPLPSTRIGEAVMPSHYNFWHTTGTVGSFGAAAAAATAMNLNRDQFMHAVATVGTFAAGLQQAFLSQAMSKPLHGGHAADAGDLSLMLAGDVLREGIVDGKDAERARARDEDHDEERPAKGQVRRRHDRDPAEER